MRAGIAAHLQQRIVWRRSRYLVLRGSGEVKVVKRDDLAREPIGGEAIDERVDERRLAAALRCGETNCNRRAAAARFSGLLPAEEINGQIQVVDACRGGRVDRVDGCGAAAGDGGEGAREH